MEWIVGLVTGVIGAIVGAGATGIPLYLKLKKGLSEIRQQERDTVIEEYTNLITKLRETLSEVAIDLKASRMELAQSRKDRENAIADHSECLQLQERLLERMGYLEEGLRNAKIPFREWAPDDSKIHKKLVVVEKTISHRHPAPSSPPSPESSDI